MAQLADEEDDDPGCFKPVEHCERKSMNDCPANFPMNDLVLEGIVAHSLEGCFHLCEKLPAQSRPLQLVPACGRPNVFLRRPSNR